MANEEQQKIPIVMGKAFLKPIEEKDHYGLFRPIIIRRPEGDQEASSLGPLMVFRKCAKDEKEDMWTFDPETKTRIGLKKVWDARDAGSFGV